MLMRRCADASPVPLSSGLLVAFSLSVVHVALFVLGLLLGNHLQFSDADNPAAVAKSNALVFLGFTIVVAVKQALPYFGRKAEPLTFDLNLGTARVFIFTIATGINAFLLGMGMGFVALLAENLHKALWPFWGFIFLFSFLGIMFGRQHVQLRPRRWVVLSSLIVAATAAMYVLFFD